MHLRNQFGLATWLRRSFITPHTVSLSVLCSFVFVAAATGQALNLSGDQAASTNTLSAPPAFSTSESPAPSRLSRHHPIGDARIHTGIGPPATTPLVPKPLRN